MCCFLNKFNIHTRLLYNTFPMIWFHLATIAAAKKNWQNFKHYHKIVVHNKLRKSLLNMDKLKFLTLNRMWHHIEVIEANDNQTLKICYGTLF